MAERSARGAATPVLQVAGLHVHYGRSHALQGVDLTLGSGVLSVVGRNGMGKTTLCKAIMGLVRASAGSIRFAGDELVGRQPAEIARLGIGYVPQGRRLWPSLTVDEHLKLTATKRGAWTIPRIYETFPRLAERRGNGGGQLSGGEQQMLAIARALLLNPRLLVMDEPTEGLAPLIVAQVEDMLLALGEAGDASVLVIEQNIGVATEVSDDVAIMVNGRVNRLMASAELAADRELQQSLLGVGRHGHEEVSTADPGAEAGDLALRAAVPGPPRIYLSNPTIPTRWSQPVPVARIEAQARTRSEPATRLTEDVTGRNNVRPLVTAPRETVVVVAGTLDTKGEELRFIRDILARNGLRTRLADLSTGGRPSSADVSPNEIALHHRLGARGVFTGDRGGSVAAMAEAFETWTRRQHGIAGLLAIGGSGGTAMATPAMRALPVGVPKVMISTVASGEVGRYVGPSDICMMYSVTDITGLHSISRQVLANGAEAMAGMVKARAALGREAAAGKPRGNPPAIGLTNFGVTTPCVQAVADALAADHECLVFHATGVGGRSMEKLVDEGALAGVIDATTTEVPDFLMGGVHPATADRFGAVIRTRLPYVGSCGALDMVNFGPADTVPARFADRRLYRHNPHVTLMRTTPDENRQVGTWIGERLNRMDGPVRFLLPEGGVSALDAPGRAFHDPEADAALFAALEATVRQTSGRRLIRLPFHINDPGFAAALVEAFRGLTGARTPRRRAAAR